MNLPLVYVSFAIIVGGLVAVTLTQTGKDTPNVEISSIANVESLITGPIANFTLNEQAKPTPEGVFLDGAGQTRTFADFSGKVVLVNFWATWCVPCIREMPALARLDANLGGDDFQVVAISIDRQGMPAVEQFYRKHGIESLELFVDAKNVVPRKLRVIGLPTTVLLSRDGQEIGRLVGVAEWDSPEAIKLLRHYIISPKL